MFLKAGDTAPKIVVDTNADLTGATSVVLKMAKLNGTAALTKTMTVTSAATGIAEYQWVSGDTAILVPGAYVGEVVVTFASGLIERFPQRGNIELIVGSAAP